MIIRTARTEDLPILLDFEQKLIEAERPMDSTLKSENISYYDIGAYITADHTEVLVAEIDGEIVGSGYGQIRNRPSYFKQKQIGYIGFIYVKENHRGKGISQAVIKKLCKWFTTKNLEEIRLTVYEKNPWAIASYEKAGMKKHFIEMRMNLNDN